MIMKKILVPTDFSDCANNAVDVAKAIAAKSGAELYFLHLEEAVPEVTHVTHHEEHAHDPHMGHARYELQHLVESSEHEGLKVHSIFVPAQQGESIEDYIKPYGIDFVVMGSHGAKGVRGWLLGSNTEALIKSANVPVLVVKNPIKNYQPEGIVFASTFRHDVSKCLNVAVHFANLWNAQLHLVFLNMMNHLIVEDHAKEIMKQQLDTLPKVNHTLNISETNDPEYGINEMANALGADTIAVRMDARGGLAGLFNTSVAVKLINHSDLPVLILNAH
jgi:nucleotide-binding universal stress UspA family protein